MKKLFLISVLCASTLVCGAANTADGSRVQSHKGGRYTQLLDGSMWQMSRDTAAQWQNDKLYLPAEAKDLSLLPVNPPTGGWQTLNNNHGMKVTVPGTVEEYTTTSTQPQPMDKAGVSWWWRTIKVPKSKAGQRVWLQFESVRMRAEVYLDGKLVGYDIIGETPFAVDITNSVRYGEPQQLAIRVTNPGGNFHWQDYVPYHWGKYQILPGRAFGGIIGHVNLVCTPDVSISDIYMQNLPAITDVNAIVETNNLSDKAVKRNVSLIIFNKRNPHDILYQHIYKNVEIPAGVTTHTYLISCPEAMQWNLENPNLYTCKVELLNKRKVADDDYRDFGFRWFTAEGIGEDAKLVLNGKRIVLRSAISWGYFPATGLPATDEMAVKQVKTAQKLGLNMLNFHRNIGRPNVLNNADSLGLLYFEEPGGYQTAGHDKFAQVLANEKLHRMIRRDRSHPSLVIYNMINEYGGSGDADTTLVNSRMHDMEEAHKVDPSRFITFTSGWAKAENSDEVSKSNMRPFDMKLYHRGWWDNHRAAGPATCEEDYYKGPTDNYMYTTNRTEVYMRGEEGAISTPPRIQLIHDAIKKSGTTGGWDGPFWESQYNAFEKFFREKKLAEGGIPSLDSLCCLMGRVQLEHQGKRIQGMRMQDIGDIYVINGWESMPYDNHSGIVDNYRNPKCAPEYIAKYNAPLYVAVCTRNEVVKVPGIAVVDLYIVNEKDVKGPHKLNLYLKSPNGTRRLVSSDEVDVIGGDRYGQLLKDSISVNIRGNAGMYTLEGELVSIDGQTIEAKGSDQVLAVDWSPADLKGSGALYGSKDDAVAQFYKKETGKALQTYSKKTGKLDWLVVDRSSLDEPEPIPSKCFKNLKLTWFYDNDLHNKAGEETANNVTRSFAAGAQPANCLPANHTFSATWEGDIVSDETGLHMLGISGSAGVRLWINGEQVLEKYWNRQPFSETRPVQMEAGKPVHIKVGYYQHGEDGSIDLKWSCPGAIQISPKEVLDRAKNDGTTVIILGNAETWMDAISKATGIKCDGYYNVGTNWVGGIHFVKRHPLFNGLPQAVAMDWPYQALVHDGNNRYGFNTTGEELVVGSYRSWPFHLGTNVGIVPYGKGCIIFSALDIVSNLTNPSGPSEVARKLFCNMINYRQK